MERALPRTVNLPSTPSFTVPTTYDIFVSGDYEVKNLHNPFSHFTQVVVDQALR